MSDNNQEISELVINLKESLTKNPEKWIAAFVGVNFYLDRLCFIYLSGSPQLKVYQDYMEYSVQECHSSITINKTTEYRHQFSPAEIEFLGGIHTNLIESKGKARCEVIQKFKNEQEQKALQDTLLLLQGKYVSTWEKICGSVVQSLKDSTFLNQPNQ